jgi:hypothetical protein
LEESSQRGGRCWSLVGSKIPLGFQTSPLLKQHTAMDQ